MLEYNVLFICFTDENYIYLLNIYATGLTARVTLCLYATFYEVWQIFYVKKRKNIHMINICRYVLFGHHNETIGRYEHND